MRAICLTRTLKAQFDSNPLVGILLTPGIDEVTANLAATFCGKAVVNLDHESSPDAFKAIVSSCQITQLLTTEAISTKIPLPLEANVQIIDVASLEGSISTVRRFFASCIAVLLPGLIVERWILGLNRQQLDDLAAVIFSRGTAGKPKGVMLTHRNLAASVSSLIKTVDPLPNDRLLGVLPLSLATGYVCTFWTPLSIGASVLFCDVVAARQTLGQLCRSHQCTVVLISPAALEQFIDSSQSDDFRGVHTLVCTGEKLLPTLAAKFENRFGLRLLEAYNCTELTAIAATNVRDKTLERFKQIGGKAGTIGQPLHGIAARIANPSTFEPLAAGEEGLLLFTGPQLMLGYWNDDGATQAVIRDGWFNTGDQAVMDEDGFITITTPDRPN